MQEPPLSPDSSGSLVRVFKTKHFKENLPFQGRQSCSTLHRMPYSSGLPESPDCGKT
jgi:hypothetical protein